MKYHESNYLRFKLNINKIYTKIGTQKQFLYPHIFKNIKLKYCISKPSIMTLVNLKDILRKHIEYEFGT